MGFCLPVTVCSPLRGCRYLILEPSLLCSLGSLRVSPTIGQKPTIRICLKLGYGDLEYHPRPRDGCLSERPGRKAVVPAQQEELVA